MSYYFLSASHVTKHYAEHTALSDVSINVPEGRIFGLLGPNGAGKTTLIRIINRIAAPDSGDVLFKGRSLMPGDVRSIGYLPEERGLYREMKVAEQAIYLAQLKGMSKNDAKASLDFWLDKFGIGQWANKKVEDLSKGMAQKVQFIITVLHKPGLLILDEPFSGFDPVNAELLKQEIMALKREGRTIIFSTHNMASVEEICDDIALIDRSKVVLSGNVGDIKESNRSGKYEVLCTGQALEPVPGVFGIIEASEIGNLKKYVICKAKEVSGSRLAEHVARQVEIRSFCEQMPSMHEIFLKAVSNNNNSEMQL